MDSILILEDDIDRISLFRQKLSKHYILTFTDAVDMAIDLLKTRKFDILFLDHDLEHKIFVESTEPNTGYQLAKYIRENNLHFKQIFIHTMNIVGQTNIYWEVKDQADEVYTYPFNVLMEKL